MAEAQFKLGVAERKHFNWLAKCCSISAIALIVYLAANVAFLFNALASGNVPVIARVLDDTLCALAVFLLLTSLSRLPKVFVKSYKLRAMILDFLVVPIVACGCFFKSGDYGGFAGFPIHS